ncbi:hypothetical protein FQN57_002993 [Myotisia sp. PD_48]|nr:hypothetical protein FQN57_002993 [Myotisia sp. PD_48]
MELLRVYLCRLCSVTVHQSYILPTYTVGEVLRDASPQIVFWPGIFSGKLSATLVGYYESGAFSVIQLYEWKDKKDMLVKWRMGFRNKQEMCQKFPVLSNCRCPNGLTDEESKSWIAGLIEQSMGKTPGNLEAENYGEATMMQSKYSSAEEKFTHLQEAVFCVMRQPNLLDPCFKTWFFYSTAKSAARWLGLDGLFHLK